MVRLACPDCGAEFNAPFAPSPGGFLRCGFCELALRDLSKLPFMLDLQAFLTSRLFAGGKGKVLVSRDRGQYVVIAADAKKPAALVCKAEWTPQNGADIPSNVPIAVASNPNVPVLMPLAVTLKSANAAMRAILSEFVQKHKQAGIAATVK